MSKTISLVGPRKETVRQAIVSGLTYHVALSGGGGIWSYAWDDEGERVDTQTCSASGGIYFKIS